jgi:hypothetical protein
MESYEHSEISANRKPKNIKKKVQDYEKLKPELIDFLTILDKPTNVKRIMKPRRGNVNHEKLKPEPLQCFDFSTISDKPTNVKRIMKRKVHFLVV